jgi:hypothetical protein
MVFVRSMVFFFGLGVGFYFELAVIFNRFVTVLNIKNTQMIEIDELTKKPLLSLYHKKSKE